MSALVLVLIVSAVSVRSQGPGSPPAASTLSSLRQRTTVGRKSCRTGAAGEKRRAGRAQPDHAGEAKQAAGLVKDGVTVSLAETSSRKKRSTCRARSSGA